MQHPHKAKFVTKHVPFRRGTDAAGFRLTLTSTAFRLPEEPLQQIVGRAALDERQIILTDVPRGTYLCRIALVDSKDEELAPGIETPLLVLADVVPITFPVPVELSIEPL